MEHSNQHGIVEQDAVSVLVILIIGFCLGAILVTYSYMDEVRIANKATQAIKSCEQSLPRDQECELVAIPKEG